MILRHHSDLRGLVRIYICYILSGYLIQINAHICSEGRERNQYNEWKWVLPHSDLCQCTSVIMGGMNTWTPIRPFVPRYYDSPLLSDDVNKIRKHYGIKCHHENTVVISTDASLISSSKGSTSTADAISHAVKYTSFTTTATEEPITITDNTSKPSTDTAVAATEVSTGSQSLRGCFEYLGMENWDIRNESITASSELIFDDWDGYAWQARLNGRSCWIVHGGHPWIQADIGYQTYVSGVVTQGDGGVGSPDWVKTLKVSTFCKSTNDTEVFVKDDSGYDKIFYANSDRYLAQKLHFLEPIFAQIVRITCLTGKKNNRMQMRFEILGCKA